MKIERKQGKWVNPISIVIPAYNEARRILPSLEGLSAFCNDRFHSYEIVCVDDGSSDGTFELISGLGDMPYVRALRLPQNRGKGYAVQYGMQRAGGCLLFFTDADLPYHLNALEAAMDAFSRTSCDLVTGARELAGRPQRSGVARARSLASRVFSGLVAGLFKLEVRDTQCGFKGFTQAAAQNIFSQVKVFGYVFDVEVFVLARRMEMKICRIPVTLVQHSGSRIRLRRDAIVMLVDLIRLALRERRRR